MHSHTQLQTLFGLILPVRFLCACVYIVANLFFAHLCVVCCAGSQSVEYKNKVWHEDCFKCLECRQPIRTQSFLTKGDDTYCTSCHEKKFANKCFHCKQVNTELFTL